MDISGNIYQEGSGLATTIRVFDNSWSFVQSTTSSSNGSYSITGLTDGETYYVQYMNTNSYKDIVLVFSHSGSTTQDVNFTGSYTPPYGLEVNFFHNSRNTSWKDIITDSSHSIAWHLIEKFQLPTFEWAILAGLTTRDIIWRIWNTNTRDIVWEIWEKWKNRIDTTWRIWPEPLSTPIEWILLAGNKIKTAWYVRAVEPIFGSFTDYTEDALLKHIFHIADFTPPDIYLGLSRSTVYEDGTNITEPGYGYERVLVDNWSPAQNREVFNQDPIVFPRATGYWGTITDWFLADSKTGGNILAHGKLWSDRTVDAPEIPRVKRGYLRVTMKSGAWFNSFANRMLDHMFNKDTYNMPDLYIALSTTTPNDDGSNITEPDSSEYARKRHNSWVMILTGIVGNDGKIQFDPVQDPDGWGYISDTVIFDSGSGGNPLLYGAFKTVFIGQDNYGDTGYAFPDKQYLVALD